MSKNGATTIVRMTLSRINSDCYGIFNILMLQHSPFCQVSFCSHSTVSFCQMPLCLMLLCRVSFMLNVVAPRECIKFENFDFKRNMKNPNPLCSILFLLLKAFPSLCPLPNNAVQNMGGDSRNVLRTLNFKGSLNKKRRY